MYCRRRFGKSPQARRHGIKRLQILSLRYGSFLLENKTCIRKSDKIMSAYFEYNFEELDNNELRINGKSSYTDEWDTIIIKKEWISWIITTLRNLTYEDYNTWQKGIENDYEDCELLILVYLFEGEWKDEERITPAIKIPYLSWNKRLLMSEFIEPFLVALSQFLTEEERGKLPPPWSEREEEKKKRRPIRRRKNFSTVCRRN